MFVVLQKKNPRLDRIRISRSKHIEGSKERLFIRTQARNLNILGVIPFVKLQNDT